MDSTSEGGSGQQNVSQFPAPPIHLARLYTDENVANGLAPTPPPPIQGHYSMFAQVNNTDDDIIQSLDSQGIRPLYQRGADPRSELKRLTRSLVAAFLDLTEILIRCPESPERQKKLEDIRLLFFNTHHLINEYRPQQARETIQLMLDMQQRERQTTIQQFDRRLTKVQSTISECLNELPKDDDLKLSVELMRQVQNVIKTGGASQPTDVSNDKEKQPSVESVLCDLVDEGVYE